MKDFLGFVVLGLFAIIMIVSCSGGDTSSGSPEADRFLKTVELAKASVGQQLRDPESAQFDGIHQGNSPRVVCGWVNSKNGFGGYAGRTRFAFFGTSAFIESDVGETLNFEASIWQAQGC